MYHIVIPGVLAIMVLATFILSLVGPPKEDGR